MSFVNPVSMSAETIARISAAPVPDIEAAPLAVDESAFTIKGLLSEDELTRMRHDLEQNEWVPVGTSGILSHYKAGDHVGSWRASVHSPELAHALWRRIKAQFATRHLDEMAATDWDGHSRWRPVGLNPLMRMIRYQDSGLLVPHYDAPYVESNERRTLVTLVVYLACDEDVTGGATRFIKDPQRRLPFEMRNHGDWHRVALDNEISEQVKPDPGSALVFDHRLLHDSQPLHASGGGCKMILRTDVMYERA